MSFYTIYRITNLLNGKVYIGKHQTENLNDGYMGSGKHIKSAIKKYGLENFEKEILYVLDSKESMDTIEAQLVNESFCARDDVYNIALGGCGGMPKGYVWITDGTTSKRIPTSEPLPSDWVYGRSSDFREKSKTLMWINDGKIQRRVPKSSEIPNGWTRGILEEVKLKTYRQFPIINRKKALP